MGSKIAGGIMTSIRPEIDDLREACDRCGDCMDDDEIALGWPVAMGEEYVCPSCYGQDAYCRDGHVLPAAESAACAACALAAEASR